MSKQQAALSAVNDGARQLRDLAEEGALEELGESVQAYIETWSDLSKRLAARRQAGNVSDPR